VDRSLINLLRRPIIRLTRGRLFSTLPRILDDVQRYKIGTIFVRKFVFIVFVLRVISNSTGRPERGQSTGGFLFFTGQVNGNCRGIRNRFNPSPTTVERAPLIPYLFVFYRIVSEHVLFLRDGTNRSRGVLPKFDFYSFVPNRPSDKRN